MHNKKIIFLLFFIFQFQDIYNLRANETNYKMLNLVKKLSTNRRTPIFEEIKDNIISSNKESWSSNEKIKILMDLVFDNHPKLVVEIGSFNGGLTIPIATALKHLNYGKIFAVDAFSNSEAVKGVLENDPNYYWWSTLNFSEVKQTLITKIHANKLQKFVTVVHSKSKDAAYKFENIDFLILDGGMSEEAFNEDLKIYLPKVRSGGYLMVNTPFMVINRDLVRLPGVFKIFDFCKLIHQHDEEFAVFKKN